MIHPPPNLPSGTAVLRSTADYVVAVHRNVMLQVVVGAIDDAFLRSSLDAHHMALLADPNGYGVITHVATTAKIPPSEVRDEATKLRTKTQHALRAQSVVIAGEGFFASTMRAVITGIVTLARSRVPLRMANDEREASAFIAEKLGWATPIELHEALRALTTAAARSSTASAAP